MDGRNLGATSSPDLELPLRAFLQTWTLAVKGLADLAHGFSEAVTAAAADYETTDQSVMPAPARPR